jgi:hypothetical protein
MRLPLDSVDIPFFPPLEKLLESMLSESSDIYTKKVIE